MDVGQEVDNILTPQVIWNTMAVLRHQNYRHSWEEEREAPYRFL